METAGNLWADAINGLQVFDVRSHEGIDAAEVRGEVSRDRLAHVTNTETKEYVRSGRVLLSSSAAMRLLADRSAILSRPAT